MTAHLTDSPTTASDDDALLGGVAAGPLEAWQQPALLSPPPRSAPPRTLRAREVQRQVGLAAIAQARQALAEASRRAREASHPHAA